jgi:hypothetical protein
MIRALGLSNSIDILKDYTGSGRGSSQSSSANQSAIMSKVRNYQNLSVQDRPIMDIQVLFFFIDLNELKVSPHHAELFLVAYGSKPSHGDHRSEQIQNLYDNQGPWSSRYPLIFHSWPVVPLVGDLE